MLRYEISYVDSFPININPFEYKDLQYIIRENIVQVSEIGLHENISRTSLVMQTSLQILQKSLLPPLCQLFRYAIIK